MGKKQRTTSRASRGRRVAALAGVAALLGIGGAGWAFAHRLTRAAPDWWRQVDAESEQTRQRAEAFENAFAKELTRVRPPAAPEAAAVSSAEEPAPAPLVSEPWSVRIDPEYANAWLNTSMKDWAVGWSETDSFDEWPKEIEQIQVAFRDGSMEVGIRYQSSRRDPTRTRVLTMGVKPWVDEEGHLWLEADSVGFGQLRLPAGLFLTDEQTRRLPRHVRELPEAQRLLRTLVGDRPATWNPVVELPDGREVRLLSVRVLDGQLELTCRTEAGVREAKAPASGARGG